jgi:hypothetical protein
MGSRDQLNEPFDDTEIARRRDEVVRRMANTPPQPKPSIPRQKKATKAVGDRAARKGRAAREGSTET